VVTLTIDRSDGSDVFDFAGTHALPCCDQNRKLRKNKNIIDIS